MQRLAILVLAVFFLAGCATPVYKEIFKEQPLYNAKAFAVSGDILYQAVLKSMYSKNFIIEKEEEEKNFVVAKRPFQRGKKTVVLLVRAKISTDGVNKSTLYLNAIQTTERFYIADRTRFFLWIVPLPGGGGKQASNVKEEEKIIADKEFYENFFSAIEEEIKKMAESQRANVEVNKSPPQINTAKESAPSIQAQEKPLPEKGQALTEALGNITQGINPESK